MIKRKTKKVWYILGIITFFLLFALGTVGGRLYGGA